MSACYDLSVQTQSTITENVQRVLERIANARQKCGHTGTFTLIAVSKMQPAESLRAAYQAGVRHFGENRVQEWEGKRQLLEHLAGTWHLIGHLQSNKSARAAKSFHSVDSIDDFDVAQRLDQARAALNPTEKLRILLEVRVSEEATKSGAEVQDLPALIEKIRPLPALELAGLMCIPPFLDDAQKVRPYFQRLRNLREQLSKSTGLPLPVVSMGMSHDFEIAIEEGATEVRIGTAIFGTRPPR